MPALRKRPILSPQTLDTTPPEKEMLRNANNYNMYLKATKF